MAEILLVDDEPAVRWAVADLLTASGHRCQEAGDGQDALRCLRDREFDLVISDVRMPRMDGFRLLESVAEERRRRMPIVFLSGHDRRDDADAALASGAFEYLVKPCESAVLLKIVERALASRSVA